MKNLITKLTTIPAALFMLTAQSATIPDLSEIGTLEDNDVLYVIEMSLYPNASSNKKLTMTNLADYARSGLLDETAASALYQRTNAALTALAANPALYQATNAALTALAANPALYQATNSALTDLASDPAMYQATNAALTALSADPAMYQATNGNLTLLANQGAYDGNDSASMTNMVHLHLSSAEAYNATTWNGDQSVPTKDALRDKIESLGTGTDHTAVVDFEGTGAASNLVYAILSASDPYDATGWNGNNEVATKDAIRDKIETLGGGVDHSTAVDFSSTGSLTNVVTAEFEDDIWVAGGSLIDQLTNKLEEADASALYQETNAALTALVADPAMYQATNAALTALAANPALYQATNANLTTLAGQGTYDGGSTAALTNLVFIESEYLTLDVLTASNLLFADWATDVVPWVDSDGSDGTFTNSNFASSVLAGSISDEVGSGSAVFNDGPDITNAVYLHLVASDAYNATTWDGNNSVPTKDALRDKIETLTGVDHTAVVDFEGTGAASNLVYAILSSSDAYDSGTWNGNNEVPTKDALRDKIETLGGGVDHTGEVDGGSTGNITNMVTAEFEDDIYVNGVSLADELTNKLSLLGGNVNGVVGFTNYVGIGVTPLSQFHILSVSAASGVHTNGLRLQNATSSKSWIATAGTINSDNNFGIKEVSADKYVFEIEPGGNVLGNSLVLTNGIGLLVTNNGAGDYVNIGTNGNITASGTMTVDTLNVSSLNVDQFVTGWDEVTPDGTNSTIDLASGNGPNYYMTLSTSNYITFSNITAGAQGAIKVFCNGTAREINWSSSYDNWSTNEVAPVFTVTNRAWIAYSVDFGTDATNVNLTVVRK